MSKSRKDNKYRSYSETFKDKKNFRKERKRKEERYLDLRS